MEKKKESTIGLIGCAMTCAGMVVGITPAYLHDSYGMTDYLCDWSKVPHAVFSRFSASTDAKYADKLFTEIVINERPVIINGDDGTDSTYSSHFVVAYGFVGTVAVDSAGDYSLTSYDLKQFKLLDPSDDPRYGNHSNLETFNDMYPIYNLRLSEII